MFKRRALPAALMLLLLVAFMLPHFVEAAAVTESSNESYPVTLSQYVPECNGQPGDSLDLTGTMHAVYNYTVDANGSVHGTAHFNPQGLSGTGQSGLKYHGGEVFIEKFTSKADSATTIVSNFRLIGQGGRSYRVHFNSHLQVNANGEETSSVDNFSITCK